MLNGKYCSVKTILDELYRDNGYTIEVPWQDAVEWIFDSMELIRVKTQYIDRKIRLTIADYRAQLPCDFHRIIQAAGSFGGCYPFAMLESTNTFHPSMGDCNLGTDFKYLNGETNTPSTAQQTPIGEDINGNPVFELGSIDSFFAIDSNIAVVGNPNYDQTTYKINENFVFTNYQEGFIYLSYQAIPVDEEGFPLIPEDTKYKEAVKAYLRMKIDYMLYRKNLIARDIYQEAIQMWSFRCGQAQNEAKMPSIDQMQGIQNQQKLVMNRFHHSNFFKNLNN